MGDWSDLRKNCLQSIDLATSYSGILKTYVDWLIY